MVATSGCRATHINKVCLLSILQQGLNTAQPIRIKDRNYSFGISILEYCELILTWVCVRRPLCHVEDVSANLRILNRITIGKWKWLLDFKRPAWSKIEGRQNIKSIEIYWSEQRAGSFSDTSLTKNQPRKTFSQNIYNICRRVLSSHWPPEPSNAPPISILLLLFPWVLQNNT